MDTRYSLREIPGLGGRYRASDDGRIWSEMRGKFLSPHWDKDNPHPRVTIYRTKGGKAETHTVHSLVALAFHGPCPDGLEVRHLDGDHRNNRPENLQYGTRSENVLDQVDHYVHNNYKKAHCKNGHLFDDGNTLIRSDGGRRCKTCLRASQVKYHEKNYTPRKRTVKTRCKHGHELSGDNLVVYDRPDGGQMRVCRACRNRRNAERRAG